MYYWNLRATYDDGYEVDRNVPYTGHGNWIEDNEMQARLEEELVNEHEGVNWYSVDFVNE